MCHFLLQLGRPQMFTQTFTQVYLFVQTLVSLKRRIAHGSTQREVISGP